MDRPQQITEKKQTVKGRRRLAVGPPGRGFRKREAEIRQVEGPLPLTPYLRCLLGAEADELQVDLPQARQASGY